MFAWDPVAVVVAGSRKIAHRTYRRGLTEVG